MMWDRVMERVIAEINADTGLMAIFGGTVRAMGTGAKIVPGLEWMLVSDREDELWAPLIAQFDLWTRSAVDNRTAERILRGLYHRDLPRAIDGIMMWTQYSEGHVLATPDRADFIGRAIRFRFTPLRQQYARLA